MEFKIYLKIIKNNFIFISIFAVIGMLLGFYSANFLPSGYRQNQTFFVSETKKDGESSLLSKQDKASVYTDSAVGIIESEDFLLSAQILNSQIEAKKLAPQVIKITVTNQSAEISKQDLSTAISKFNEKTQQLLGDKSIQLVPIGPTPAPTHFALNTKIMASFGALIGIISSAAILALLSYLKL
jgi:capsular polysaccharide biosynthesis protein